MFENIGSKIRGLARLILLVGVMLSAIAMIGIWITGGGLSGRMNGFMVFLFGLLMGALGCLCAWVGAILIYGFGQLIEDTETIRHNTEDLQYEAEALRHMMEDRRRGPGAEREKEE